MKKVGKLVGSKRQQINVSGKISLKVTGEKKKTEKLQKRKR